MVPTRCMKWLSRILGHWLLREVGGVVLLLAAIVCLPVWVSRWYAVDDIPFQEQTAVRDLIKVSPSRGEIREAMAETVLGQLQALRERNFEEAREFASDAFRRHLPVSEFERMVSSGFTIMTEDHRVEIGGAFNNEQLGFVDVKLDSPRLGIVFYSFVLEATAAGWFVRGVETIDPRGFESRRPRSSRPRASFGRGNYLQNLQG